MDLSVLLQGIILGLSIAAPVGPIGLLCIHRTLVHGKTVGFLSGLGAASADMVYGFVAAFGVTTISGFLLEQHRILEIGGGFFLLYLGYRSFSSEPAQRAAQVPSQGLFHAWLYTFGLTLTNPMTILAFSAIFAGVSIGIDGNYRQMVVLVGGIFFGSLLWWLLLSTVVAHLRSRFDYRLLVWVNRFSGIVIMMFGLISLIS
mgnify:FL=1